jgi:hypothetical protein
VRVTLGVPRTEAKTEAKTETETKAKTETETKAKTEAKIGLQTKPLPWPLNRY